MLTVCHTAAGYSVIRQKSPHSLGEIIGSRKTRRDAENLMIIVEEHDIIRQMGGNPPCLDYRRG